MTDNNPHDCQCEHLPSLFHEVLQSAQVIQAYAWGCQERMMKNTISNEEILQILSTIHKQIEVIGTKINEFSPSQL